MNLSVDEFGNKRYYNEIGRYHRIDGPAVIDADGSQYWYQNGLRHRTDGPAVIHANGTKEWYQHGRFIRQTIMQSEISEINFIKEGF